jgi:hypothetical protein
MSQPGGGFVRSGSPPSSFCCRLATKLLFLLRNRAFRFTADAMWP